MMSDKSNKIGCLTLIFTALGVVVAFVVLWAGDTGHVQRPLCTAKWPPDFVRHRVCRMEYWPVSVADATDVMDKYLTRAGGPEPGDAYAMLGESEQDRRPRKEYIAEWTPVGRAERVSELRSIEGQFNWYEVEYRTYEVPVDDDGKPVWTSPRGPINEWVLQVRFQRNSDSTAIEISETDDDSKTSNFGKTYDYAWATFVVDTVTRRGPSDSTGVAASDVRSGKGLRVLCQLETDEGSSWFASYIGWFPSEAVDLSDVTDEGVLRCSPFAADDDGT
jgi:hypothetical protein